MASTYNLDRIRLESIERRRQENNEVLKARKNDLKQLYGLSYSPLFPLTKDDDKFEDTLMAFLEKNDLQSGYTHKEDTLQANEVDYSDVLAKAFSLRETKSETDGMERPKRQLDQVEDVVDSNPTKLTKPDTSNTNETEIVEASDESKSSLTRRPEDETLSLHNFHHKDLKNLELLLMPEVYPTEVNEVSSLAELHYITQTLPLVRLLPNSHKTLTTDNFESALLEGKVAVIYSRIEELKRQKKWSLRQPIKYNDPLRKQTHWDNLIEESKWMSVDFREGRKFKISVCVQLAQAVTDYWNYGKIMCIRRKAIVHLENVEEANKDCEEELVDKESETIDIFLLKKHVEEPEESFIPRELPEITKEDFLALHKNQSPFKLFVDPDYLNPRDKSIIENLPVFDAFDSETRPGPLDNGELRFTPVSKLLMPVDEDQEWTKIVLRESPDAEGESLKSQKGLFSANVRKYNILKPPQPPSLKNIENRTPTIWLPSEDQQLIHYVAEYAFNWGIISSHLAALTNRRYFSNIERRTPWQCFERYIQLNDKFQFSDMKGAYAYQAQMWLEAAHKAQVSTKRRISPLGVSYDSVQRGHTRLRWASMLDAIRKVMKKRENAPKQAPATVRKGLGDDKRLIPTPAELSKLKFERDKAIQEAYISQQSNGNFRGARPNMPATAAQQAARSSKGTSAAAVPNNGQTRIQVDPAQRAAAVAAAAAAAAHGVRPNPGNIQAQQQKLQQTQMQLTNSGNMSNTPTTPNGTAYTPEQIQLIMKQRRLLQQQQQQQQALHGGQQSLQQLPQSSPQPQSAQMGSAPSSATNSNANTPILTQAVINNSMNNRMVSSPIQQQTQMNRTQANSLTTNTSGTPVRKMNFVPAHVSAIINQIQTQNPNFTKEQVTKMAAQYLASLQQQQNRNLVSSNATQANKSGMNQPAAQNLARPTANTLTPQQREQLNMLKALKAQQQQQQQQQSSPTPTPQQLSQQQQLEYEQRKKILIQKQQQAAAAAAANKGSSSQMGQFQTKSGRNSVGGSSSDLSSLSGSGSSGTGSSASPGINKGSKD